MSSDTEIIRDYLMTDFSISTYPDVEEIYRRLDTLMQLPIYGIKRDAMTKYLEHFDTHCAKSKEMVTKAREFIPGGVQHNLAFNHPFPIVIEKADGAYLWDIDGNRYIDFLQAGGPTMLGSNYKPVREKIIKLIDEQAPVTGLFSEYEFLLAKEINKHMPSVEMFRMLGSGTEAAMGAIRVARLASKRKKIIKLGGGYHGWSDQLVYGLHIPGTGGFEAHGIPKGCRKNTQEIYPNKISALKKNLSRNKLKGGTAAVIIEPMGPESGTRPVDREYIKEIQELCEQHDVFLIFDEVVTFGRIGLSGAQGYFGIKPDLSVFGKVIAGGYPGAGGIGGRRDIMVHLSAGIESGKKRAYVGGTLAASPISSAAGYFTIQEMEKTNACQKAGHAADRLTSGLEEMIQERHLPYVAYNQGAICHLETVGAMFVEISYLKIRSVLREIKERKFAMEEMGAAYMAEGIVTLGGSRMYTSMADTDEVVDDALTRFAKVFDNAEKHKTD